MLLLFISSFLAATFIPFSSEIHFAAVIHEHNVFAALVIATIGNTLGGMFSYWIGWLTKWNWIEKYLRVKREKIERFQKIIEKNGGWLGFLCWAPIIGDVIAIGLGVFRANKYLTFFTMLTGKFLRYLIIALIVMGFCK